MQFFWTSGSRLDWGVGGLELLSLSLELKGSELKISAWP